MDLNVRFWNDSKGQVETRYFDSQFLKHPNAQNLFNILILSMEKLNQSQRLIQLSMDGPNTVTVLFHVLFTQFLDSIEFL